MFASFCAIFVEVAVVVVVGSKRKIVWYDVLSVEATASKSDMRKNTPVMRHSLASISSDNARCGKRLGSSKQRLRKWWKLLKLEVF